MQSTSATAPPGLSCTASSGDGGAYRRRLPLRPRIQVDDGSVGNGNVPMHTRKSETVEEIVALASSCSAVVSVTGDGDILIRLGGRTVGGRAGGWVRSGGCLGDEWARPTIGKCSFLVYTLILRDIV